MRVRWAGTRLLASLIGVICATALAACVGGTVSNSAAGTAPTTGPITLSTNLKTYTISDAVGVSVVNATTTDYFAVSGKSACVIIQLERYNSTKGVWERVDPCPSQNEAQAYLIAKGSQQQFTLAPMSSADSNAWATGLYRVTLTYSSNSDGLTNPQQAHSAAFDIR